MTDASRQARHELRTPVNHILSYARLVLEEADELGLGDDLVQGLTAIEADGQQALTRIDALLERAGQAERAALGAQAARIAEQAEGVQATALGAGQAQVA